jgi:hypothetical protein
MVTGKHGPRISRFPVRLAEMSSMLSISAANPDTVPVREDHIPGIPVLADVPVSAVESESFFVRHAFAISPRWNPAVVLFIWKFSGSGEIRQLQAQNFAHHYYGQARMGQNTAVCRVRRSVDQPIAALMQE